MSKGFQFSVILNFLKIMADADSAILKIAWQLHLSEFSLGFFGGIDKKQMLKCQQTIFANNLTLNHNYTESIYYVPFWI